MQLGCGFGSIRFLTIIADLPVWTTAYAVCSTEQLVSAAQMAALLDRGDIFGGGVAMTNCGGEANNGMSLILFSNEQGVMQAGDLVRYQALGDYASYTLTIRIYNDRQRRSCLRRTKCERRIRQRPPIAADGEFYLSTNGWTVTRHAVQRCFRLCRSDLR